MNDQDFLNIDVLHQVGFFGSEGIKQQAVEMKIEGHLFFVMHRIDVLIGRAENFRGITNQQNPAGLRQVKLAVNVAEQYITATIKRDEKIALKAIEKVAKTARSTAGLFARKHNVEIYDAIRPDKLLTFIDNSLLLAVRLPRLISEIKSIKSFN